MSLEKKVTELEAKVERLEGELALAIDLLRNQKRIAWGWNPEELCHDFMDGK